MPIYEYKCGACDHRLEALQKVSEEPLRDCPQCSEPALKKLVSATAFRLKGSGWYETDFKSGNRRNVVDSGGGESKSDKSDSKGDKTETKSQTAKEAPKSASGDGKAAKPSSSSSGAD